MPVHRLPRGDRDPPLLEKWGPPGRVIAGDPVQSGRNYYADATGQFSTGIWECTPGKWRVDYTEDEFSHLLVGKVVFADAHGASESFVAGDSYVIPAGFRGTCEVVETARKIYAVHETRAA
ncbi:MAG: cupin domain-containing protein [Alphaproteobacteria bacterium]